MKHDAKTLKYFKKAMHLFFTNIGADLLEDEAIHLLESAPDDSDDFGQLQVVQEYEYWSSKDLWCRIEDVALHFKDFE